MLLKILSQWKLLYTYLDSYSCVCVELGRYWWLCFRIMSWVLTEIIQSLPGNQDILPYQIKQIKAILRAAFISSLFITSLGDLVHSSWWVSEHVAKKFKKLEKPSWLVLRFFFKWHGYIHTCWKRCIWTTLLTLCFMGAPWVTVLLDPQVSIQDDYRKLKCVRW